VTKSWSNYSPKRRNRREWQTVQVTSPYADGVLPDLLQNDVSNIRKCLRRWLSLSELWQEGADNDIIQATIDLARKYSILHDCGTINACFLDANLFAIVKGLEVHPDHAFAPAPKPLFRRIFVTLTKTYWLAMLASLDSDKHEELSHRLDLTPPYGRTIPRLPGRKCVYTPGEMSAKEMEGLMWTVVAVTANMVPTEVTRSWRELAEVGVQLWEESHELRK
jgi:hypothetical protein